MFLTTPRGYATWPSQRPKTTTEISVIEHMEPMEWSLQRFLNMELTIPEFIALAVVFGIVTFLLAFWLGMHLMKTCIPVARGQFRRIRVRNTINAGPSQPRRILRDSDADNENFSLLVKEEEKTVVKEVRVILCDSDEEIDVLPSVEHNKIKQHTKELDQSPAIGEAETSSLDRCINVPIDSTDASTVELVNEPFNDTEQELDNSLNEKKENLVAAMVAPDLVYPSLA